MITDAVKKFVQAMCKGWVAISAGQAPCAECLEKLRREEAEGVPGMEQIREEKVRGTVSLEMPLKSTLQKRFSSLIAPNLSALLPRIVKDKPGNLIAKGTVQRVCSSAMSRS